MRPKLPETPPPQTIREAQTIIRRCFKEQPFGGWDKTEQCRYFKLIGVVGMDSPDDVRRIYDDLKQAKMI